MINIIISVVILLLIILYLSYNKEKFISLYYEEHIEYLKEKIKELNTLKKYNFKNVDGSDTSHTLLDNLIYKRALLDSTQIEKKLNEIYQKIS